jgi:V8-like Glu-specific endopeptidase
MKKKKNEITDRPLLVREWAKMIPARRAKKPSRNLVLQMQGIALPKQYRQKVGFRVDKRTGTAQLTIRTRTVGKHFFPRNLRSVTLSSKRLAKMEVADHTHGLIPAHLPLAPFPGKLDRKLVVRRRFGVDMRKIKGRDLSEPTNVFGADDRYVFSDTSFPWSTCGKVETEAGWGSGVMIGPRHVMTASHVIVWKPNNTAGWVKFTPLKFDNSEPFGSAFATLIYSWNKADGSDGLNQTEGAFDYVVCVLDSYLGNVTGWMGSRGYDTDWDGGNYWGHVGYPNDLGGGTRPIFIGYQSFINEDSASVGGRSSYRIRHEIDVIPGQSGGAYFGWWSGEPWPRVVSIQSGQNWGGPGGDNSCGGGNPLSELINYGRNTMP